MYFTVGVKKKLGGKNVIIIRPKFSPDSTLL